MTQTGSNEEKNWRLKISLDCPFKSVLYLVEKRNNSLIERQAISLAVDEMKSAKDVDPL